jgi:hypothetical protein
MDLPSRTPRRPEEGPLHRTVAGHLETFLGRRAEQDQPAPGLVERQVRSFLECGVLARGDSSACAAGARGTSGPSPSHAKEFRFPRSTILLMLLILVGVVLAIGKRMSVQLEYAADANALPPWSMLPGLYLMPFVLMCVFGVAGYAILVALRQSGSHRLSSVRTWPERR